MTLPRVTEILSDVGLADMAHVPEYALERGTVLHHACHLATIGTLDWDTLHADLTGYVKSWLLLCQSLGPTILAIEKPLEHPQYAFRGTPDLIVEMGGHRHVLDWKSNKAPKSTRWQTAAYSILADIPWTNRAAIELQEDGSMARMVHYDKPANRIDRDVFLAALTLYRAKRIND